MFESLIIVPAEAAAFITIEPEGLPASPTDTRVRALYNNGDSPAPKEITQNEYTSLLLETGLLGVFLVAFIVILAVKVALKNHKFSGLLLSLIVAYAVTLFFFSGLPNALQIVLLPGLLMLL